MYIITHHDADGMLASATLMKALSRKFWLYFSSPNRLLSTICNLLQNTEGKTTLYICDIGATKKALACASAFEHVVWIDHHVWENCRAEENIEIVLDAESKSATRVAGNYTGFHDFVEVADEIDTNNVQTESGARLRDITFAIKMLYPKSEIYRGLCELTLSIAEKGLGVIYRNTFDELLAKYNLLVETAIKNALQTKQDFLLGDKRISVVFMQDSIPIAPLFNKIENTGTDIIVFVAQRSDESGQPITKLEFRTQTQEDVLKIARAFGGGGHLLASGATCKGMLSTQQILEKIRETYGW